MDTGEPLRRARVILSPVDDAQEPRLALSGADGRFSFLELKPGRYRLTVEKNGYVSQGWTPRGARGQSPPLTLRPGETVRDLIFRLVAAGVITGRVLDEESEPTPGVFVEVLRHGYQQGRRTLVNVAIDTTNDLGEYRVFGLPPGRYLVSATYMPGRFAPRRLAGNFRSGPVVDDEKYAPTYYPGTPDVSRAGVVEVLAGQQVAGIDFTLLPARTIRVSGKVTNSVTGQPAHGAQVLVLPREAGSRRMAIRGQGTTNEAGEFESHVFSPGSYDILAFLGTRDGRFAGRVPIEVGAADVQGIRVTLGPSTSLSGHVRVEGTPGAKVEGLRVMLRPRDNTPFFGGGQASVNADGSFLMENLIEGVYLVSAGRMPEDFYVKAARLGNDDVLEAGVNVTPGPLPALDVVLSPAGGRVEGLVLDSEGLPIAGTVVLVPEPRRRHLLHLYKSADTDPVGRFLLRGVAPGDYKVFAWEEVEPGAYQDPDFLQPVESRGVAVRVTESSAQGVEVKVIPGSAGTP